MKTPKISVVMTAYNAENHIGQAIESILNQTFANFEFIIINDGSTDSTAEMISSFVDSRIQFINNKRNQGLTAMLNQGFDLAKGEYIARMDADDISLPERFAKQVAFMDANPDTGVLGTWFQNFGADDAICEHIANVSILDLLQGCQICHPSAMLRKSMFDKHDLRYSLECLTAQDYELWSRAVRVMKIANLQEVLLRYRWHETNVSIKRMNSQKSTALRVQQNILDFLTNDERLRKSISAMFGIGGLKTKTKLFGFITLMTTFHYGPNSESKEYFLFGFIPAVRITKNRVYACHYIPFAKTKINV